jgi:hypothetical protein
VARPILAPKQLTVMSRRRDHKETKGEEHMEVKTQIKAGDDGIWWGN